MITRTSNRIRPAAAIAIVLASMTALTACGGGQSGETTTIRYQSYSGSVDVLQLADALGYLKGLKLKKVGDVTGGPQSLQALTSHQVDISSSAFFGAIAQVVSTGAPIKAVVSTYGSNDKTSSALVTLEGSPITSAKDLIGKKVAVNTLGANAEAVLDVWLQKSGLDEDQIKEVTLVPLPPLNMFQALQQHQVDVASVGSGQLRVAESTGLKLQTLVKDIDVIGPYNGGGVSIGDDFLKKNPKTSRELITGIAKAVAYVESHDRADVLKIYDAWLRHNGYSSYVQAVDQNWSGTTGVATPTTAAIGEKDFSIWVDWLKGRGTVKDSISGSDIYTNEYNDLAKG
jgi:ABC-type nitrate/sulfonate/bicarbonate transport system substrate-binding protein